MSDKMIIRKAEPRDAPTLLALIRALATYERAPNAVTATEADLLRDGFGNKPRYSASIAELDGKPAGFSLWFFNYSTWRGHACMYLEDLFVLPESRGRGLGRALFADLARTALEEKCTRIDWMVLDWNAPAIAFYERLGAKKLSEWFTMRLDGNEALQKVMMNG